MCIAALDHMIPFNVMCALIAESAPSTFDKVEALTFGSLFSWFQAQQQTDQILPIPTAASTDLTGGCYCPCHIGGWLLHVVCHNPTMDADALRMLADLGLERRDIVSAPECDARGRPIREDPRAQQAVLADVEARRTKHSADDFGGAGEYAGRLRAWNSNPLDPDLPKAHN